ncbi:MAG: hypothetical protein ACOYXY_05080 [Thermodesulfobacteriota bacterium]
MEADLVIGSALLAIAWGLGTFMVFGWVAAMRPRGRASPHAHSSAAMELAAAQCVYDCLIWFQEDPDLVGYCGQACGIGKK